jgi:hypothetical protein
MRTLTQTYFTNVQITEILRLPEWQRDHSLLDRTLMAIKDEQYQPVYSSAYLNTRTREVLLVFSHDGSGDTRSSDEFERFLERLQAPADLSPRHILDRRFRHGLDFPSLVPQLIVQLPLLLSISAEELDLSMSSLHAIDKALEAKDLDQALEEPYFSGLLAYCGEVMRLAVNGQWQMVYPPQFPQIWEPWIVPERGTPINLGHEMVEALHESVPFSIAGSLEAARFLSQPR